MSVGIVTPTLNAEAYLERCLSSIWGEASESVQIDHVVVDGGSSDRTLEVASEFPSHVIQGRDGGMYEAVNKGMGTVDGDVVGYINADDEFVPRALHLVLDAFRRHPDVSWVTGGLQFIDGEGRLLGTMQPVPLSRRAYLGLGWSCIPQPATWLRRSFFTTVGAFDTSYRNCADYEWFARALAIEPPLILGEPVARFRLHGANISRDAAVMQEQVRRIQTANEATDLRSWLMGRVLSLRLNLRNPRWLVAKKTGRIRYR